MAPVKTSGVDNRKVTELSIGLLGGSSVSPPAPLSTPLYVVVPKLGATCSVTGAPVTSSRRRPFDPVTPPNVAEPRPAANCNPAAGVTV